MKIIKILPFFILSILNLNASEEAGIQVSNRGLVTKIIPMYRSPNLQEAEGIHNTNESSENRAQNFSKYKVELKKSPTNFEREIKRLESLPPMSIPIKSAPLHAAIRLCAEAANMNYIAPPVELFKEKVTLKVKTNPYEILKMLSDHHSLGMEYERGMWQFFRVNENELITRKYQLRYNNQEIIHKTPPSLNKTLDESSRNAMCFDLNGDSGVFSIDTNKIIYEIQKILDLPTTGLSAVVEEGGSVDNFSAISKPSLSGSKIGGYSPQGQVLYVSDSNELMVIASRQQHSYIQSYLETIDKPQRLIKIEAKFVETSRDPKSEIGIDWSGVSGAELGLSSVTGDIKKGSWPATAILSASDMKLQFHLIKTDSQTTIVQDPQVVTTNNRKVSLKSVVQQPIESANNNQTTSGTSNSTSTIDYLEIGTMIDVFPKIMSGSLKGFQGESVQLNISIVVSSIVGEKEIRGNPFPVVSSRTYDYSVIVPSGYTLAIGGLSEYNHTTTSTKVPGLGNIPLIGNAFRRKKNKQSRRNLIAYLTPTILGSNACELSK